MHNNIDINNEEIAFNSEIFKSILCLNKKGKLDIAFDGMYKYTSIESDIEATYYQKSLVIKK
jgi:hypothetical protein